MDHVVMFVLKKRKVEPLTSWLPAIIWHIHTPPRHPHALSVSRSDTNRNNHTTYATPPAWTTTTTTCNGQLATTRCTHPCLQCTHALNAPMPSTLPHPQCTHALNTPMPSMHPRPLCQQGWCQQPCCLCLTSTPPGSNKWVQSAQTMMSVVWASGSCILSFIFYFHPVSTCSQGNVS